MRIGFKAVSVTMIFIGLVLAGTSVAYADTVPGDVGFQQDQVQKRMQALFQTREKSRSHQADNTPQGVMMRERTRTQSRAGSMSMGNPSGNAGGSGRGNR